VSDLLELIGLGGLGQRRPHELSGGQQQRVAVARALAPEPRLILLDEPFAALDASLRDSLRAEIKQLLASLGTTVVLVTHDQEEALSLADVVAILYDGRIVQHATPRAIYQQPETLAIAHFLGDTNLVAARFNGGTAHTPLGELPVEPGSQSKGAGLADPARADPAHGHAERPSPAADRAGDCGDLFRPRRDRAPEPRDGRRNARADRPHPRRPGPPRRRACDAGVRRRNADVQRLSLSA
jgi:iron(III) transport system ATP-binding protein